MWSIRERKIFKVKALKCEEIGHNMKWKVHVHVKPEGEGWRGGGVNHEKKETGKGGGGYAEVGM